MTKNVLNKTPTLYRVAKFEVVPTEGQLSTLLKVVDNLRTVWNEGLRERESVYKEHIAPLYEALKTASSAEGVEIKKQIKQTVKEKQITLFGQINTLTSRRKSDPYFASVQRNWQEETLDTLNSSFTSFYTLRKNGDFDARPPKERREGLFFEVSGRSGWKIEGDKFFLSCKNVESSVEISFRIPRKQVEEITRGKVKKFTLYRDQKDLASPGRFWVSLAYEFEQPLQKTFDPETAVYVALGASAIGIVSVKGEKVIKLARADFHWKPEIVSLEKRAQEKKGVTRDGERVILESDGSVSTRFHPRKPRSQSSQRVEKARKEMFRLMATQNNLNHREIVARDLIKSLKNPHGHGYHFVVSEVVVRSKQGKLADGNDSSRGGELGLNWSAQNTGSFAYLVSWLTEKAREVGGTVQKWKVPEEYLPKTSDKIAMAHAMRNSFIDSQQKQKV